MASSTKIGYVSRDPSEQINWAEVGANFTGMLKEEARVREEKKAEIDSATREMQRVFNETPMGDSGTLNEWALNFGNDAQKQLLMVNTLLKSGQLKPQDYTVIRQNLADGTDQAFTLLDEYNKEYTEKMERMKSNDPNASSQMLESWLMESVEGLGNFSKSKLMINPQTGNVMVGFIDPKTGEVDSDPNKLAGVNSLRNRIKAKYDKYDMTSAVTKAKQETFGQFQAIERTIGTARAQGLLKTYNDPTMRSEKTIARLVKEGIITAEQGALYSTYDKTENAWLESQLSQYNTLSLLTDNLRQATGKNYKLTFNPDERSEDTILIKQIDGQAVPDFEGEIGKKQREDAKKGLQTVLRGALDHEVKVQTVNDYTPPQQQRQPTEYEIRRGENAKIQADAMNNIAKLYSGEQADLDEAATFLRTLNPNISLIDRNSQGVIITFSDGRIEQLDFGNQRIDQWVKGSSNFFLSPDNKIVDVNDVWRRSGGQSDATRNTSAKGTFAGQQEKTEPVTVTFNRVLEEKGFVPSVFIEDGEDTTVDNVKALLASVTATSNWTVEGDGSFDPSSDGIIIKDNAGKEVTRFDLDNVDAATASTYIRKLKDIIYSVSSDADKASLIEGKALKTNTSPKVPTRKTATVKAPITSTTTTKAKGKTAAPVD